MIIGYCKHYIYNKYLKNRNGYMYTDYLFEIEVLDNIDIWGQVHNIHSTYFTSEFKILCITNWKTGQQIEKIDDEYETNKIVKTETLWNGYFFNKEEAISNDLELDDLKIYLSDKHGMHIKYRYDGEILESFYHNYGKKEGIHKIYDTDYNDWKRKTYLSEEIDYLDGKKYGKSIIYHLNGTIFSIRNYIQDKLIL